MFLSVGFCYSITNKKILLQCLFIDLSTNYVLFKDFKGAESHNVCSDLLNPNSVLLPRLAHVWSNLKVLKERTSV